MDKLVLADQTLFHLMNARWNSEWLDLILPLWRNRWTWVPLYLGIAAFTTMKLGRQAPRLLLFAVLTVVAADALNSQVLKPAFERPRPCHQDSPVTSRTLIACGPAWSFPSSHAVSHMTLAVFLILALRPIARRSRWLLLPWAGIVAWAQVYVGVHYPADVSAGMLLGAAIGTGGYLLYRRSAAAPGEDRTEPPQPPDGPGATDTPGRRRDLT